MTLDAAQDGVAVYFDGKSNRKRGVTLRFGEAVEIVEDGALADKWPYGDVRRVDGPLDSLRLSSTSASPLARLEIADEATKQKVVAQCPSLDANYGGRQAGRVVFWSLAAACSIVVLAYFGIPLLADRLAPMIPQSFERRLGDTFSLQIKTRFGGKTCDSAAGQAAFTALVEKLARAGGVDSPPAAQVLSSAIPNAFALPGGHIFLLKGLLQKAQNPDEIAGILAHELGHVAHRDHMRRMIQTGGTSYLFGLLFGDVTGAGAVIYVGRSLIDASYSREAEERADSFAIDVMHKLGRSPKPMGELLFRVTGAQQNNGLTILASHPLTEMRRARMIAESGPDIGEPLLSAAQWQGLKNICGS
jgi:Zn-dependent protease with chaperone function